MYFHPGGLSACGMFVNTTGNTLWMGKVRTPEQASLRDNNEVDTSLPAKYRELREWKTVYVLTLTLWCVCHLWYICNRLTCALHTHAAAFARICLVNIVALNLCFKAAFHCAHICVSLCTHRQCVFACFILLGPVSRSRIIILVE